MSKLHLKIDARGRVKARRHSMHLELAECLSSIGMCMYSAFSGVS